MDDEALYTPRLLDQTDRRSVVWLKLAKHLEARLDELRAKNDNDLDPIATAKLRGEVAGVKAILSLGDEAQQVEGEDD